MASEKQIAANRQNAQRSTGPKSAAGKRVVGRNALRHGFLSRQALLPGENSRTLAKLRRRVIAAHRPAGGLERLLVDRIVQALWRLRRLGQVETGLFVSARCDVVAEQVTRRHMQDVGDELWGRGDQGPMTATDAAAHAAALQKAPEAEALQEGDVPLLGRAFVANERAFSTLLRYETNIERGMYKALHELQRLQAARSGQLVPPPMVADVDMAVSVEGGAPADSAKQSQ